VLSLEQIALRILLAFVLSGIIGMERESGNRPAGLRTHILVCLGSTLVMLVSFYLFEQYSGQTSLDPARLGAQVISGIGFLGAGTILKEGATIRGLTTAAALWAVACIGLAIGVGFFSGAVMVTAVVVITLTMVNRLERKIFNTKNTIEITIKVEDRPGELGRIGSALGSVDVSIGNIEMSRIDDQTVEIVLFLKLPDRIKKEDVIGLLSDLDGVKTIADAR
jgi:putative Mg2+ transporter-C (MgtC) family protein